MNHISPQQSVPVTPNQFALRLRNRPEPPGQILPDRARKMTIKANCSRNHPPVRQPCLPVPPQCIVTTHIPPFFNGGTKIPIDHFDRPVPIRHRKTGQYTHIQTAKRAAEPSNPYFKLIHKTRITPMIVEGMHLSAARTNVRTQNKIQNILASKSIFI